MLPAAFALPTPLPRLLYLFGLVNLVIGSAAFMNAGLLAPIAQSLGISVSAAGQTTTVYSLATAALAPAFLVVTARLTPRVAVVIALGLFALGNAVMALAQDLSVMLLGRVLMGCGASASALMAGMTMAVAPVERRAQALSIVFVGMGLSYVTGIPLATWAGLAWGWRVPVWVAVVLTLAAAFALWWSMPTARSSAQGPSWRAAVVLVRQPAVLALYVLTLTYFIAIFAVFSYIGPVLQSLRPMDPTTLSLVISAFGCAGTVGTLTGGRAADRLGPRLTLSLGLAGLAICLLLLPFSSGHLIVMTVVLMFWGACSFSMMAPQQLRLAQLAGPNAALALSLNNSMLYLGIALGAALGGAALTQIEAHQLPWVGAPFAMAALAWLRFSTRPR